MKEKSIAVIDLKAFYSYVECIDRGLDPWTTPLVVADKERGTNTIVLSVTPFLKKQGIPSRLRLKELPKGIDYIYAIPRMARYIEKSSEVISIILDFVSDEDIHVYSIDEAFVDLTSYLSFYKKTPLELVKQILKTIKNKTGLEATAGIGDNFFLAKVALDIYAKKEKDGVAIMKQQDVKNKIWPITDLTKIWGIGQNTAAKLNRLGIFSMKDLALSDKNYVMKKFGIMGEQLHDLANGIDDSNIREVYIPKENSLTNGQTLFRDYNSDEIITVLREMNDDLAYRMRSESMMCNVISLFIGYSKNIGGFSRQMSLLKATDDTEVLFNALTEIFYKHIKDYPIRHISICFGKLEPKRIFTQLDIFDDASNIEKRKNLQLMLDTIHNKYGKNIALRASALTKESTIIERHNQIGGHRK